MTIEPGDLVRVIRSHCPAAWEEEQGTYFVVQTIERIPANEMLCTLCRRQNYPEGLYVSGWQGDRANWLPAAWLRKVPGLTADEIAEDIAQDLEVQDA